MPDIDYFAVKAWPTRAIGAFLLLVFAPFILLLAVLARVTSAGPGLYCQTRTGKHGKAFRMYKIRTMLEDAESASGPIWSVPGDSRITPVGRMLRLLHWDELPQLINVVRGEMDLIGPRPERPVLVERLAREIPDYCDRLQVLPGVTGLAQINLPPDKTMDCVRKKLLLDSNYIRTASPGLDLRILICTALRMIGIRHGRAARWLRLERQVQALSNSSTVVNRLPLYRKHNHGNQPTDPVYSSSRASGTSSAAIGSTGQEMVASAAVQETVAAAPLPARKPR